VGTLSESRRQHASGMTAALPWGNDVISDMPSDFGKVRRQPVPNDQCLESDFFSAPPPLVPIWLSVVSKARVVALRDTQPALSHFQDAVGECPQHQRARVVRPRIPTP
jgi:hypothetical protein